MKKFFNVVLLGILISLNCSQKKGTFSFFPVDMSSLTDLQKKWYQPSLYKQYQNPIFFEENKTIWYAYKPSNLQYNKIYAISLLKKTLGYIEIDLKNQRLSHEIGHLIDNLENLEIGHYALKIAYEGKIMDEIYFEIIESSDKSNIDYDISISNDHEDGKEKNLDDIEVLSN
ncbi:MAG: hypothetical protein OEZ22_04455 [Spirochaetia bacterium]|nr:hypothetical protein [Spirochaetia bacterium]